VHISSLSTSSALKETDYGLATAYKLRVFDYRRIPSNELDAKSTTPLAGRVTTPTRPLPTPDKQRNIIIIIIIKMMLLTLRHAKEWCWRNAQYRTVSW